jgi:transposase
MKTQNTSTVVEPQGEKLRLISFSDKDIYVGIDVHKNRWQTAVYCQGVVLSNTSMDAGSSKLIEHLRKRYGDARFHCVYEAGAWGFTLCRDLWAAGMECIIVNPADIPDTDKDRRSKTDAVDARKLASLHAAGLLTAIHVPSEKLQKQRSLIRFRKKLWSDLVRAKNRLKSQLKFQGITIPAQFDKPHWSRNFLNWIEEQAQRDDLLKDTLLLMLEEVKSLRMLLLKTEKKLRELMRSEDFNHKSEVIRSVPAVGPFLAMLFLLEVGDIRRFKDFDSLNRFVGLCPDSHSSGDTERHTGISQRRHKQLRSLLIEAAWQLMRYDPAMLEYYKELTKRMKGQLAIVRVARKLLRRIRAVLLSDRMYVKGIDGNVTAIDIKAPDVPVAIPKVKHRKEVALATAGMHHQ